METKIRQANTSDIERIQELSAELSQMEAEEYDPSIDPEWVLTEEATHWYQDRISQDNGFAVVAHDQNQIIGYAVGVTAPAEPYRTTDTLAELETMYLTPENRGQGIGTQLVQKFKNWAEEQDADRLRVEATAQNQAAIKFYQNNDFKDYALTLEADF